jgi:hypothetical protein
MLEREVEQHIEMTRGAVISFAERLRGRERVPFVLSSHLVRSYWLADSGTQVPQPLPRPFHGVGSAAA